MDVRSLQDTRIAAALPELRCSGCGSPTTWPGLAVSSCGSPPRFMRLPVPLGQRVLTVAPCRHTSYRMPVYGCNADSPNVRVAAALRSAHAMLD